MLPMGAEWTHGLRSGVRDDTEVASMKVLMLFLVWCILLVLAWPIALLALVLLPLVWLLASPFRLLGLVVAALFALLKAVLTLPARLLNYRG